jgi:ubiquinone/menaquinone biosynthesis C-methylase UbiE
VSNDQQASVARVFGLTAAGYDQSGVDFFSLFARRLVYHLQPGSGWHVVNVGSGRGAVVFALPGTQCTVTAIDLADRW